MQLMCERGLTMINYAELIKQAKLQLEEARKSGNTARQFELLAYLAILKDWYIAELEATNMKKAG